MIIRDKLGKFKIGNQIRLGTKQPEELKIRFKKERTGICLNTGKTHFQKGNIPWNKGIKGVQKWSEESKLKLSESLKKRNYCGNKVWNWKGGTDLKNKAIRKSLEYKLWREQIFEQDDYTCWICGDRSGNGHKVILHPHHLRRFADFIKSRFNINNGITLCEFCHKTYTKFGRYFTDADIYGHNGRQTVPVNIIR